MGKKRTTSVNRKKTDRENGTNVKLNYKPPTVEVYKDKGNQTNCEIYDFSCKKVNIIKKHMNMKHVNNKCNMCDKEFPNSMDSLAHAAKDHSQNINEGTPRIRGCSHIMSAKNGESRPPPP